MDIIVNFRTTFFHSTTGNEIYEPKEIAKHYLKGRFWPDILATIPFDTLLGGYKGLEFLSCLGLIKVTRVFRLGKLITKLNITEDAKLMLKLFKLVFNILLFIHCVGCTWFYVVNTPDPVWIPPTDFMYLSTDLFV